MRILVASSIICLATHAAFAKTKSVSQQPHYHVDYDVLAYTPTLAYPTAARQQHIQGGGFYLLSVDVARGVVRDVKIERSTGSKILDDAAVKNLKGWLFKPPLLRLLEKRHPPEVAGQLVFRVPIIFRL